MFHGYEETEAEVLKIALCRKYQELYSDLETLCKNCGLYEDEIKEVKAWKYHGRNANPLYLTLLLDYIRDYETERYDKSLYIYHNQIK